MILSQVASLGEMLKIEHEELVARTKLQDIIDEKNFVVFQPTVHGIPLRPKNNMPMRISFCKDNGVFEFEAVMEKTFLQDNIRVCQFKAVSEISKKQRRSSYRLPVVIDAKVSLAEPEVDIPGEAASYDVQTRDLSAGGISFVCYEYFPAGALVNVAIKLEDNEEMIIHAKIIRCIVPSDKTVKYSISAQFVTLPSKEQAKISKFILKTQIKKRNRIK